MSERKIVFKIVKELERTFPGLIAYAYQMKNISNVWWEICVDNYEIYYSGEFKVLSRTFHKKATENNFKILFCYCKPIEKKLIELSEENNLILNL